MISNQWATTVHKGVINYFTRVSLWAMIRNKYKEKSQIGAEMRGCGVFNVWRCASGSDFDRWHWHTCSLTQ